MGIPNIPNNGWKCHENVGRYCQNWVSRHLMIVEWPGGILYKWFPRSEMFPSEERLSLKGSASRMQLTAKWDPKKDPSRASPSSTAIKGLGWNGQGIFLEWYMEALEPLEWSLQYLQDLSAWFFMLALKSSRFTVNAAPLCTLQVNPISRRKPRNRWTVSKSSLKKT